MKTISYISLSSWIIYFFIIPPLNYAKGMKEIFDHSFTKTSSSLTKAREHVLKEKSTINKKIDTVGNHTFTSFHKLEDNISNNRKRKSEINTYEPSIHKDTIVKRTKHLEQDFFTSCKKQDLENTNNACNQTGKFPTKEKTANSASTIKRSLRVLSKTQQIQKTKIHKEQNLKQKLEILAPNLEAVKKNIGKRQANHAKQFKKLTGFNSAKKYIKTIGKKLSNPQILHAGAYENHSHAADTIPNNLAIGERSGNLMMRAFDAKLKNGDRDAAAFLIEKGTLIAHSVIQQVADKRDPTYSNTPIVGVNTLKESFSQESGTYLKKRVNRAFNARRMAEEAFIVKHREQLKNPPLTISKQRELFSKIKQTGLHPREDTGVTLAKFTSSTQRKKWIEELAKKGKNFNWKPTDNTAEVSTITTLKPNIVEKALVLSSPSLNPLCRSWNKELKSLPLKKLEEQRKDLEKSLRKLNGTKNLSDSTRKSHLETKLDLININIMKKE